MWNFELVDYMQFITDIAFIEKLRLSISYHFYSNNIHFKDIRFTVL